MVVGVEKAVDVVLETGDAVPSDGVGRQVWTRRPCENAASPSGRSGSLKPAGRLPTAYHLVRYPHGQKGTASCPTIGVEVIQTTHTAVDYGLQTRARKHCFSVSDDRKGLVPHVHRQRLGKCASWCVIVEHDSSSVDSNQSGGLEQRDHENRISHGCPAIGPPDEVIPTAIVCGDHAGVC